MINVIAKIFAIPVKIINILLSVLLVFTPLARIGGILMYIVLIPLVGFGLFGGESPKWEMVLTALLVPTALTFAEISIQLFIMLTESLYKWLMYTDHRSAKVQIEEYIAHQRYRELKEKSKDSDGSETQELAQKLRDIYEKGG
ncbi:MAG: ABC transporter permease [Ruminococcus sp.]|nr:ABC transporter permease [Ruminococcus sp.]